MYSPQHGGLCDLHVRDPPRLDLPLLDQAGGRRAGSCLHQVTTLHSAVLHLVPLCREGNIRSAVMKELYEYEEHKIYTRQVRTDRLGSLLHPSLFRNSFNP